ncbi:hypothetical protein Tco_1400097 [Tanacetum coccineum]
MDENQLNDVMEVVKQTDLNKQVVEYEDDLESDTKDVLTEVADPHAIIEKVTGCMFWSASGFVCGSASMFDLRLLSFVFSSKQDVTISSRSFVVFHGSSGVWVIGLVVLALWTTGLYHPS